MAVRPDIPRRVARAGLRSAPVAVLTALSLGCSAAGPTAAQPIGPLKTSPDGRPLTLAFSDEFNSFRRWSGSGGVWRTTFRDGKSADDYDLRTLKWNKEVELYVDPDLREHSAGGRL